MDKDLTLRNSSQMCPAYQKQPFLNTQFIQLATLVCLPALKHCHQSLMLLQNIKRGILYFVLLVPESLASALAVPQQTSALSKTTLTDRIFQRTSSGITILVPRVVGDNLYHRLPLRHSSIDSLEGNTIGPTGILYHLFLLHTSPCQRQLALLRDH